MHSCSVCVSVVHHANYSHKSVCPTWWEFPLWSGKCPHMETLWWTMICSSELGERSPTLHCFRRCIPLSVWRSPPVLSPSWKNSDPSTAVKGVGSSAPTFRRASDTEVSASSELSISSICKVEHYNFWISRVCRITIDRFKVRDKPICPKKKIIQTVYEIITLTTWNMKLESVELISLAYSMMGHEGYYFNILFALSLHPVKRKLVRLLITDTHRF